VGIIRDVEKKCEGNIVAHWTHKMGRSGRVAASWLIEECGLSPFEATNEVMILARKMCMEILAAPYLLQE